MITTTAKTRIWGNSLGIRVPKNLGIAQNQEVIVHILEKKKTCVKDILGTISYNKSVSRLMKDVDKELNDDL